MFPRHEALRPEFFQWRFAFATLFVQVHNGISLFLGRSQPVKSKAPNSALWIMRTATRRPRVSAYIDCSSGELLSRFIEIWRETSPYLGLDADGKVDGAGISLWMVA